MVRRLECSSGVTGDVHPPTVEVGADDVVVTFTVASLPPGDHTCPGNEQVRVEVDVGEPIGDRFIRDGECRRDRGAAGTVVCMSADGSAPNDVRWPEQDTEEPHRCPAPDGSSLDVADEPGWRRADDAVVTDEQGCIVRVDVIAVRPGPAGCGFGRARVLVTGDPFGTRYTSADSVEFVRDPDGVFGDPDLAAGYETGRTLPSGAEPTGHLVDGHGVWLVPDDPSAVWIFTDEAMVERWPRGVSPPCR